MLRNANHPSTHMTISLVIWYVCMVCLSTQTKIHHSHLMRFGLEVAKTMKQTNTGFKEKIFILQPLSKPNLEIKSKTNQNRKCQFL